MLKQIRCVDGSTWMTDEVFIFTDDWLECFEYGNDEFRVRVWGGHIVWWRDWIQNSPRQEVTHRLEPIHLAGYVPRIDEDDGA